MRVRAALTTCLRSLGYLAFVVALAALSLAARLLGEDHALGYFSGRLSESIGRYPEVTRRGIRMAWLTWALLLALAVSPWDPIASRWDEVVLLAIAAAVAWRRLHARRPAGR
jgi:hypothetical protein